MATIPVEKKSGTPIWMWLLPLLLLGLLLAYFLTRDGDDEVATTDPAGQVDTAGPDAADPDNVDGPDGTAVGAAGTGAAATGAAGGAITSVNDLYGESLTSLVGRSVEIEDATVLSVTGDSTFYVGADGRRFLVALSGLGEEASGPGDGSDGRFNIDAGDRISLRGTVTRFDATNSVFGRLSEADRAEGTTRGAYVNVTRAADVATR